jgi:hypothetical protein
MIWSRPGRKGGCGAWDLPFIFLFLFFNSYLDSLGFTTSLFFFCVGKTQSLGCFELTSKSSGVPIFSRIKVS